MNDENQEYMREWARDNGKSVHQRTVRQETTKYKAGTLPLNMYERTQPIGEKLQFGTPSADNLNVNQLGKPLLWKLTWMKTSWMNTVMEPIQVM